MKILIGLSLITILLSALVIADRTSAAEVDSLSKESLPSSLELVERAQQDGKIDQDTAILYKVLSIFEPQKLPAQYQSTTPAICATQSHGSRSKGGELAGKIGKRGFNT